jgi:phosphofructokinase-like protein
VTKKLGLLTGGGDAPGLNAVIRTVVKTAPHYDYRVVGIRDGFDGLLDPEGTIALGQEHVRGILPLGGTILGTANRGNPFARKVETGGNSKIVDVSDAVVARAHELDLEGIVVVGGDGTLHISLELTEKGCPIVGVPKTIDNDIGGTDISFGFDTAVNTAMEALDRLHTTAESHHRVMVLELMGRDAGFIALHAGLAGGADVILIPEIPFKFDQICEKVAARARAGRHFSIIAAAEGAHPQGGDPVYAHGGDELRVGRLGGIGQIVAQHVEDACQMETRVTVLGHLQRGGSPTAFDRWLCTRLGAEAVRLAAGGQWGRMAALHGSKVESVDMRQALTMPKRVDLAGDAVRTAREIGISLGD